MLRRYQRDENIRRVARLMWIAGFPIRTIARVLRISHARVQYWRRADRWEERGNKVNFKDCDALEKILPKLPGWALLLWYRALEEGSFPKLPRRLKPKLSKFEHYHAWHTILSRYAGAALTGNGVKRDYEMHVPKCDFCKQPLNGEVIITSLFFHKACFHRYQSESSAT